MRTKLLIGTISSIAVGFFLSQGLRIYSQSSCGQYFIFEPSCSELLSVTETQKLLQSNQSVVKEIKQINPGQIEVYVREQPNCSNKAIVVITHSTEKDCDLLNNILRRNVFNVPYKIVNN